MFKIEIFDEQADEIVKARLKRSIENLQQLIEQNADWALDGSLAEDILTLYHLMRAYNYFVAPDEGYDVP